MLSQPPQPTPPSPTERRAVLVSDFDGTMTACDFFELALNHLTPGDLPDYWGRYLSGEITHFEALQAIFARIRGDEQTVLRVARQAGLDPQLHSAVARLQTGGWNVIVVSAGCQWYVKRLLGEQGVRLEVIANPGEFIAGHGLQMTLPADSPFFSPSTGVDKQAVVRHSLGASRQVAFAGDGRPDLEPARLVAPDRRFARGWLADKLSAEGEPFRRFERWSEIADMLLNGPAAAP